MEFQGTITGDNGVPVGTLESVQARLSRLFPGAIFEWSPSGVQKLADLDARGIEIPAAVRSLLQVLPSTLGGELDDGALNVTFNIGSNDVVLCVWVTVGGDEVTAAAALARLKATPGWRVVPSVDPADT